MEDAEAIALGRTMSPIRAVEEGKGEVERGAPKVRLIHHEGHEEPQVALEADAPREIPDGIFA
jgi:hypothetical protein